MGLLQEAENKQVGLKAKLSSLKAVISTALSLNDPDFEDRENFDGAKRIAKEKAQEWSKNQHQQNSGRIGEVRKGRAHVIFTRNGIENAHQEEDKR